MWTDQLGFLGGRQSPAGPSSKTGASLSDVVTSPVQVPSDSATMSQVVQAPLHCVRGGFSLGLKRRYDAG